MRNPLLKWFAIWLGATTIIMIAFALFGPKGKKISLEEIDFTTNQSSELYFKNMRSYFYELEEHKESGYFLYRIGSRDDDSSKLHFVLLHNWRMNEAYILVESDIFEITDIHVQSQDISFHLESEDSHGNYTFAARLFELLSAEKSFDINFNDQNFSLTEAEKKSLRKSLYDYFKLVGKLR